jgi:hypothetical protein
MTTRTYPALLALVLGLLLTAPAASANVTAHLRVLTPNKVLDPGTDYIVDQGVTVPTRPDADCFGPPGGSGTEYTYDRPNALSLLATAGRTDRSVAPLLLTDQFGFGLGICGIGGREAVAGESFWYFKAEHQESTLGADQVELSNGDEVLFYLAPDRFPEPNPAELELRAPAGVEAGEPFTAKVVEHSCVTDQDTFETTCASRPAPGVTVTADRGRGAKGEESATTADDGKAELTVAGVGEVTLTAERGSDIPAEGLDTCVGPEARSCPDERGIDLVGSPEGDRIDGTAGDDEIRSRGGDDNLDLREGGVDDVDCGPGDDVVRLKRKFASDGLEIDRSCEKIKKR